ncbi:MAG TPA: hypothetical protein VHP63_03675 [candidate division Zixibacteria bacterium]|nr:hypothetical protein [candidate division Zixibacteria bacterium]
MATVILTLFGFAALLSHSAHHDSGHDNCFACKFSSLLWIFAVVFILFGLVERELFRLVVESVIPRSRHLTSSGKRAPPLAS